MASTIALNVNDMTRAEEQALKAYPREDDAWCESNVDRRIGYKQGYNQAEQDFMSKVEEFLVNKDFLLGHLAFVDFKKYIAD